MQSSHAMGGSLDPELMVEQGPHQGARIALPAGCYSVGSALSNDVVLLDPRLASHHFTVDVGPDSVFLTANSGPIHVRGRRRALRPGAAATRCTRTIHFKAGDTSFLLSLPTLPLSCSPGRRRVTLSATGAAAFAAFVLLFTFASATDGAVVQPFLSKSVVAEAMLAVPAQPLPTARDVVAETQAHLKMAQLDTVTMTKGPDGALILSGTISPAQEATLRNMQHWFDGAFGARMLLLDQVRVAAEKPPLAVQAAWTGTEPYIIDGSGQKLFLGARLADGWTVLAITPDTVLLQRGARSLAVHF